MNSFSQWARRLALAALATIAILATLWGLSRALYPTAEQRDALALMQLPAPPPGENAFAAMWTLDRAVPPAEMQQVIQRDAVRVAELPPFPDPDNLDATELVSAAEQYPDLAPSRQDRDLFCNAERDDCLDKVRQEPSKYRALVERNRELLDRIDALADYDYVRQQLPWHMSASIAVPSNGRLSATRHALWFNEGRVDDALAASCRGIDTWRRLGASGDTLILRLIANSFAVEYHGKLLAEMLAELPLDHPLPPECAPALAPPPPQELSLCTAMRGESELSAEITGPMLYSMNDWWSSPMLFVAYDVEATEAARAQNLAPICAESELERIAADQQPEVESHEVPGIWRLACLGNFIGCTMNSIGASPYASYRIRMQNFGARIKLLATLAWLRENADQTAQLDSLLEKRPEALKSPTRQVEIGEDGDSLQIRMFGELGGETWAVPLPADLRR